METPPSHHCSDKSCFKWRDDDWVCPRCLFSDPAQVAYWVDRKWPNRLERVGDEKEVPSRCIDLRPKMRDEP